MKDHRSVLRKDTSLKGQVVIDDGATVACIVSNVSTTGAKINVPLFETLPSTFILRAADLNLNVRAKVVWREEAEVGVRFLLNQTP